MKKVIFILIGAIILSLYSCNFLSTVDYSTFSDENSYTILSGEAAVNDIENIQINWVTGSVKIETYDGDAVKFFEVSSLDKDNDALGEATENKTLNESLKLRYKTDGGKLIIQFCKSGLRVRSGAVKDLKKDLTVYVPAETSFSIVEADVVSSDVYMNGLTATEIKCNGVSAESKLVDCKVDSISCKTVSGDTEIITDGALKKLSYDSVSGDLKIDAESVEELTANGVSADISLTLKKADFTLKLTGATASLEANGINYEKTEEKAYKFGDGAGNLKVDCVSGKVSVTVK